MLLLWPHMVPLLAKTHTPRNESTAGFVAVRWCGMGRRSQRGDPDLAHTRVRSTFDAHHFLTEPYQRAAFFLRSKTTGLTGMRPSCPRAENQSPVGLRVGPCRLAIHLFHLPPSTCVKASLPRMIVPRVVRPRAFSDSGPMRRAHTSRRRNPLSREHPPALQLLLEASDLRHRDGTSTGSVSCSPHNR